MPPSPSNFKMRYRPITRGWLNATAPSPMPPPRPSPVATVRSASAQSADGPKAVVSLPIGSACCASMEWPPYANSRVRKLFGLAFQGSSDVLSNSPQTERACFGYQAAATSRRARRRGLNHVQAHLRGQGKPGPRFPPSPGADVVALAAKDGNGKLWIALTNLDRRQPAEIEASVAGPNRDSIRLVPILPTRIVPKSWLREVSSD